MSTGNKDRLMDNTLHLTLKKKWFDMILSGEKKEEYREINPYWTSRFYDKNGRRKRFDYVEFVNGYSKDARRFSVQLLRIDKGYGDVALGAPADKFVYILSLGNKECLC